MIAAEEIANDESRNWDERIRAAAELEYEKMVTTKQTLKLKPLSLVDRAYVARYHEHDGPSMMGLLFEKSPQGIDSLITTMKRTGEYEIYRNLTDEEYEKMINTAERSGKYEL